jgi:hypothetical protein
LRGLIAGFQSLQIACHLYSESKWLKSLRINPCKIGALEIADGIPDEPDPVPKKVTCAEAGTAAGDLIEM